VATLTQWQTDLLDQLGAMIKGYFDEAVRNRSQRVASRCLAKAALLLRQQERLYAQFMNGEMTVCGNCGSTDPPQRLSIKYVMPDAANIGGGENVEREHTLSTRLINTFGMKNP